MFDKERWWALFAQLARIERKLNKVLSEPETDADLTRMETLMADIKQQIVELTEKARNQGTVIDGVATLVAGLKTQIESAAGQLNAGDEAAASATLAELAASLDANTTKLMGIAVAEGTGAGDEPHAAGM